MVTEDITLICDLSEIGENYASRLKPVKLTRNCILIMKSYEIIIIDLDEPTKGIRYSLGNW